LVPYKEAVLAFVYNLGYNSLEAA